MAINPISMENWYSGRLYFLVIILCCELNFNVLLANKLNTNVALDCISMVEVNVDTNCEALVSPLDVLATVDYSLEEYELTIFLGTDTLGNLITVDYLDQNLSYYIFHEPTGESCSGTISATDISAPDIICTTHFVSCVIELTFVPSPEAFDNCDTDPDVTQLSESFLDNDICDNDTLIILRGWIASDYEGNESGICKDTIVIVRPPSNNIDFPDDFTLACELYNVNQDLVLPSTTGSPNATNGAYCNYEATYSDEILEGNCSDFTITRTWVVTNWCNGEVISSNSSGEDNIQLIEVVDMAPPQILSFDFNLEIDQAASPETVCTSEGFIPAAMIEDNCNDWTVNIFTPVGEVIYENGVDGKEGGTIPAPGLGVGAHIITYVATDSCGNTNLLDVTLTVTDSQAPVVNCPPIREVELSSGGIAFVDAIFFDNGSSDLCCIEALEVKKVIDGCNVEGNTEYSESLTFCCEDIELNPVTVYLRATDCYGNSAECEIPVLVKDLIDPVNLSCPADQIIDCNFYDEELEELVALGDYGVLDQFGLPLFADNCTVVVAFDVEVNLDDCYRGTLTRAWSAQDQSGNGPLVCVQNISIRHVSDMVVEFPADLTIYCEEQDLEYDMPEVFFDNCEVVGISYNDEQMETSGDACFQINRTWAVINWCVVGDSVDQEVVELPENMLPFPLNDLDGDGDNDDRTFRDSWNGIWFPGVDDASSNGEPDTDDDNDPWDGYIEFDQIFYVLDTVAPVFDQGCDLPIVCISTDSCTANVNILAPLVADCSGEYFIEIDGDLGDSLGIVEGIVSGSYDVTFEATDACGNMTICETLVQVEDCTEPIAQCVEDVFLDFMPGDDLEFSFYAVDFDDGSSDNCTSDVLYSFSSEVTDTFQVFSCQNLGEQAINLWVTDDNGNQTYCQTFLVIQDPFNLCEFSEVQFSGLIQTEEEEGISEVEVNVVGDFGVNLLDWTDGEGAYDFIVPPTGDYTITPIKDENPINGVSTFDLVKITKHILNTDLLDSPYQIIAADANGNDAVTTIDLVILRKLILFIDTDFANNTSWRFVDASYEFPNPMDPFEEEFPESISINNAAANLSNLNFVAIKIGDVNGSVGLLEGDDRAIDKAFTIEVQNQYLEKGKVYPIHFKASDFNHLGFQFNLQFDTELLAFQGIGEGLVENEHMGLSLLEEGKVFVSWHKEEALQIGKEDKILTLFFEAKENALLSDLLTINEAFMKPEAYDAQEQLQNVELLFQSEVLEVDNGVQFFQNYPNPFKDYTEIRFFLPKEKQGRFSILDAAGNLIMELNGPFKKGMNYIDLSGRDFPTSGVYFYYLEVDGERFVKKLIKV